MTTLLILEHSHHSLHSAMPQLLSAALQLQQTVTLLLVGDGCQHIAQEAASLAGVELVLVADNPCYQHQLAENVSQVIASIADSYTHILMHASPWGRGVLPRVAALLNCPQVSEVTAILSADTVTHPIYAGNALETVKILTHQKIMTIRSIAFDAVTDRQKPCEVKQLDSKFYPTKTTWLKRDVLVSARPELAKAPYVVSGGRGLQTAQQFKLVEELADVLGAAVGATRAAVDAGFVSNEYQVGQTGKIIAPLLYIAVGISGAIQHVAGMMSAKVIVAINKDADAPIMQLANYALVGDLFELLPELIECLKQE